jgi:hypothetical protein
MMDMDEVEVIVEEVVPVDVPVEEDIFVGDLHPIHLKWYISPHQKKAASKN